MTTELDSRQLREIFARHKKDDGAGDCYVFPVPLENVEDLKLAIDRLTPLASQEEPRERTQC